MKNYTETEKNFHKSLLQTYLLEQIQIAQLEW